MKYISQDNKQAFRNPWVIGWISAILLVIAVNVVFIITAAVTNPGLVDEDYYEKGRDYEKNFQSKQAIRNELGWQMSLSPANKPVIGEPVTYTFNAVDPVGIPIAADRAVLNAYRPSDVSADFQLDMNEVAAGVYSVEAVFPLKGIWDVTATLHQGDNNLDTTRRISVSAR
jgi:nitrogen fixation protein FixH